jgi:hypothetical protein
MQQAFSIIHSHDVGDLGKSLGSGNGNTAKAVEKELSWCGRRLFILSNLLKAKPNSLSLPWWSGARKMCRGLMESKRNWISDIPTVHGQTTTSVKLETLVEGR